MKSFIISVVLLSLITASVFINAQHSRKLCTEIADTISEFPEEASGDKTDAMIHAEELFNKHSVYFSYILSKSDLLDLFCDFSDVFSYHGSGDTASYLASLERLKNRLNKVKSSEEISFKEIFGS